MYRKAYDFVREILDDSQINDYVHTLTGKNLAVIEAGAKVTSPSAQIIFSGGNTTRRNNTSSEVSFDVEFLLPFWGADAFTRCLDFIDTVIPVFFDYREARYFISRIDPAIHEPDELLSQIWRVTLTFSVTIFL